MKSTRLKSLQNQLAQLEKQIETERREQLRNAHAEYGYADRETLIQALQALGPDSNRSSATKTRGGRAPAQRQPKSRQRRRTRATITPEMKSRVRELAQAGKMTSAQIAKDVGISLPSVQNIKKEFGLVRGRN